MYRWQFRQAYHDDDNDAGDDDDDEEEEEDGDGDDDDDMMMERAAHVFAVHHGPLMHSPVRKAKQAPSLLLKYTLRAGLSRLQTRPGLKYWNRRVKWRGQASSAHPTPSAFLLRCSTSNI